MRETGGEARPGPRGLGAILEMVFMPQRGKPLQNSEWGSDINMVVLTERAAGALVLQETAG